MKRSELIDNIFSRRSFLCVGLDSEKDRLPSVLSGEQDPVFKFNREIIDFTREHAIAYKINTAFYEAQGSEGWECLERTIDYIPDSHLVIVDAKRGDIGNTSRMYSKAFFEHLGADALTVVPYMGSDSVKPFYRKDKWVIILALTSNEGAKDFQLHSLNTDQTLYEHVIEESSTWGDEENTMFVAGATRTKYLRTIRAMLPRHFLLVPGIGRQGGSLEQVCEAALTDDVGLIVNASRSIIFASEKSDFAKAAQRSAASVHEQMASYIRSI